MPKITPVFLVLSAVCVWHAAAEDLAIDARPSGVVVSDRGRPVFEFIHSPPADVPDNEFFPTHYIHPLYGLMGETVTGETPSVWGGAPGVHWGWSRSGINRTRINIEDGSGGRRVFERLLGGEVVDGEGIFAIQSAWVTDADNQAKMLENFSITMYPVDSTSRMFDVYVLIRNISESTILLEGGVPGSGLTLTLNPERTDWAFTNSVGWVKEGVPYMSPWTVGTYRDDRRSTRSGIAVLQDSRNPGFSTQNWVVEDGPRVTVGAADSYKHELKSAAFLEFRYRIILFRVIGGGPNMTSEFTKFMGHAGATE